MIENERSQVWLYAAKVKGVFSYSETKREERGVGKHNGMTKTCAAGGDVTPHTPPQTHRGPRSPFYRELEIDSYRPGFLGKEPPSEVFSFQSVSDEWMLCD